MVRSLLDRGALLAGPHATLLCQEGHPMRRTPLTLAITLGIAAAADAATLTITPDKTVYVVGESITLNVLGDPQSEYQPSVNGRILFDSAMATYISSSQTAMTQLGGLPTYALGLLVGGPGFADAFNQGGGVDTIRVECCLIATVVLSAIAPGTLDYSWDDSNFLFFSIKVPPAGGSVTIVPEPSTVLLLATGLISLAIKMRQARPSHPQV